MGPQKPPLGVWSKSLEPSYEDQTRQIGKDRRAGRGNNCKNVLWIMANKQIGGHRPPIGVWSKSLAPSYENLIRQLGMA